MKIQVFLFLVTILMTTALEIRKLPRTTNLVVSDNTMKPFLMKTPEERRNLTVFPKNASKYIVNSELQVKKLDEKHSKNPIEANTHIKPKRVPLMKLRKITTMLLSHKPTVVEDAIKDSLQNRKSIDNVDGGYRKKLFFSSDEMYNVNSESSDQIIPSVDRNTRLNADVGNDESTEKTLDEKVQKRNVIVEENLGSTESVLKFTGKESRLNSRATFKNINE